MRNWIQELVFGSLVGAVIATVLVLLLFYRDLFSPLPTLVPSVEPLSTALPPTAVFLPPTEAAVVRIETSTPAMPVAPEPKPVLAPAIPTNTVPALEIGTDADIMAVGDSVMLGGALELRKLLGNLDIDARVGRQPTAGINIIRAWMASGQASDVVIVHLGNNGPFRAEQIDEMMSLLAGVRLVVFVNVKVPRRWEAPNNVTLAQKVQQYPNVALVDWYGATVNRPDLFYEDGVHLRPEGAKTYAALIAAVLAGH
jgi:hypothetical protein